MASLTLHFVSPLFFPGSRSGVNSNDQDFDRTTGADRREDSQGRATGTHTTDQSIGSKIVNAIRGDKNA